MAGIALVLELWYKNPTILLRSSLHSHGFFPAKAAVSSAAFSTVVASPLAAWAFLGYKCEPRIGHCDDAGLAPNEDYSSSIYKSVLQKDIVAYHGRKEYSTVELKPLWSVFHWKTLGLISLRYFLLSYWILVESHENEDEDEDEDKDEAGTSRQAYSADQHLVVEALITSLKLISVEAMATTTRRILERLIIHYLPRRTAWKLLKDASESAARKAARGMPSRYYYIYRVGKATVRVHSLSVVAFWIVQVGKDVCWYSYRMWKTRNRKRQARLLGRNVSDKTLCYLSSLIFAPVGAGIGAAIGATILHPSMGQWIGCLVGDLGGSALGHLCSTRLGFTRRI